MSYVGLTKQNTVSLPIVASGLIRTLMPHRLADMLTTFERIRNTQSRLRMVHGSEGVTMSGQKVLSSILRAKEVAYKLVDVIEELQKHLTRLEDDVEISPSLPGELNSISASLSKQIERLRSVYGNASHTQYPVLLHGRCSKIVHYDLQLIKQYRRGWSPYGHLGNIF